MPQPAEAKATTTNVDAELATQAGPQLVVPILNARYALNAANAAGAACMTRCMARMRSAEDRRRRKGKGYNPVRGAKVIAFARQVLDDTAPLAAGSHKDSTGYRVEGGQLVVSLAKRQHHGPERRCRSSRATRAMPLHLRRCCCSTTACTSISSIDSAARPSAQRCRRA